MRKFLIAGNWKMHKTPHEAVQLAKALRNKTINIASTEIVVCPPFVCLTGVAQALRESNIELGGQNLFWEDQGAFTGEISAPMLQASGCRYVIVGHSERRQYFNETEETVNRRLRAALTHELSPIFCIGETLEEREEEQTFAVLQRQLDGGLAGLDASDFANIVIAYEPVWAIGTGRNATPAQAEEVHNWIRERIAASYGRPVAERLRILYGGSVKPANAVELLEQPDVDGALVGGASLDAGSFAQIIKEAEKISNE